MNMNMEEARANMLSQQLRACNVLDDSILAVLASVPREDFVPPGYENLACADQRIPLGFGEEMMTPTEEGTILQALHLSDTDRVLEIGTGSGYLTALLASHAKHVHSLDIIPEFTKAAEKKLKQHHFFNVSLMTEDGANGWEEKAPYDVIVLTGSVPRLPQCFIDSLAFGGRLFAIVGNAPAMTAKIITRVDETHREEKELFDTCIKPLQNCQKENFIF